MPFEIDFLTNANVKQDADAICLRFNTNILGGYTICIFDGGTSEYANTIKEHITQYYGNPVIIDYVFCSHPDQDHASGLKEILETCAVRNLVMNRPWLYARELFPRVSDGRITVESLERRLRENFPYAEALEEVALRKGINIIDAFQGQILGGGHLRILSPSKSFYLDLLAESNKSPDMTGVSSVASLFRKVSTSICNLLESWWQDSLRETSTTSAENESSIVLYGNMPEEKFLLTGDAGIRALNQAIDYAKSIGIDIKNQVSFYQIPHHGGRHNLSPSLMDKLVGPIVSKSSSPTKSAIVSVAKESNHPKKMVVNAFIRRGCSVSIANKNTICYHNGIPGREGWVATTPESFSSHVEDWED